MKRMEKRELEKKEQERLKKRKKSRLYRAFNCSLLLCLVGLFMTGVLLWKDIAVWAGKHYLRTKLESTQIKETDEPDAYEQLGRYHDISTPLNVLLVALDKGSVPGEEGNFRSDVIMLASCDIPNNRVAVVSIPRDTKIRIDGYGYEKINAAHALNGASGIIRAVKELTDFEIHHFIRVDFEAFKAFVNAIGGVPFYLERDIKDKYAGYLSKGEHNLNGDQALTLVRSRQMERGDLDRIDNQHKFMKALAEKLVTITDVGSMRQIINAVDDYFETTMTPDFILNLGEALSGTEVQNVTFATIPGSAPPPSAGGAWYFIPDIDGMNELLDNVRKYCSVNDISQEIKADSSDDGEESSVGPQDEKTSRSRLSLTVLNGSNVTGLAGKTAEKLKQLGYSGIECGDARNRHSRTTVYYKKGFDDEARILIQDLGFTGQVNIYENSDVTSRYNSGVVLVVSSDISF